MDYVVSPVGTSCIRINLAKAISVVFEMARKRYAPALIDDKSSEYLTMCRDCHSIFTELFNSYKKFLKTTVSKSYIRTCVRDCLVWKENENEMTSELHYQNESNLGELKIQFEVIKNEDENEPSHTVDEEILGVKDSSFLLDHVSSSKASNSQDPENDRKILIPTPTAIYVEKSPLINIEKLPIHEANCASNWEYYLEKVSEHEISLQKSTAQETTCKSCGRQFLNSKLMKTHVDLAHKQVPKTIACQLCDNRFSFRWFHKHHIDVFHSGIELQFVCKICDKVFKTLKELNHHKSVIHHRILHPFRCLHCEQGYKEIDELRDHLLERHSSSKEAQIAKENREYILQNQNQLQIKELTNPETFSCSLCDQNFNYSLSLDKHVRYFHEKRTSCVFCNYLFSSVKDCKAHETQVHDNYECTQCEKSYATIMRLKAHLVRVHYTEGISILCEVCGKSYPTLHHLRTHYNWHKVTVEPPKYICNICSKPFNLKHSYVCHLRFTHAEIKRPRFECVKCKKLYYAKSLLQQHNEKIHGFKDSFKCSSCDRTFPSSKSLKVHSRTHWDILYRPKHIATGEGEFDIMACYSEEQSCFICSICDAKVARKDHFVRHVQSLHTAVKKVPAQNVNFLKCETCEKTFESREVFMEHVRINGHKAWTSKTHIKISESQIEAYECDVCGKFIKGKYHFQRHLKIHNKNRKVGRRGPKPRNKTILGK